eukprot:2088791-Pleurochrysis_carterae.AAC.1
MPNSSAAGMDNPCSTAASPVCPRSAARASRVAAARVSAACTSAGHTADTSHTSPARPAR